MGILLLQLIPIFSLLHGAIVTVSNNPQYPAQYSDIQQGINAAQNGDYVVVYAGNYTVSNLNWSGKHIQLITSYTNPAVLQNSSGSSAIRLTWSGINRSDRVQGFLFQNCTGSISGPAMYLNNGAAPTIERCTFSGCTSTASASMGGAVYVYGYNNPSVVPLFNNCTFTSNFSGDTYGGGAVGLNGCAEFTSCTFSGNLATTGNGTSLVPQNSGGAVIVKTTRNAGTTTFQHCTFSNNQTVASGADVYVHQTSTTSNILFEECQFEYTSGISSAASVVLFPNSLGGMANPQGTIIFRKNVWKGYEDTCLYFNDFAGRTHITFNNNILDDIDASGFYLNYHGAGPLDPNYLTMNNNTFRNIAGHAIVFYQGADYKVNNCVFDNIGQSSINWGGYAPGYPEQATTSLTINHCLFTDTTGYLDFAGNTQHPLTTNGILFDTTANLNATTYVPVWSSTARSLCIDNGNPDLDGDGNKWYADEDDQDADSTRLDIGAVPAMAHKHSAHTLEGSVPGQAVWNWISFPAIDKLYEGATVDNLQFILHDYHGNNLLSTNTPRFMDQTQWKYNTSVTTLQWVTNHWDLANSEVRSQYGYKVKMADTSPAVSYDMDYDGFLAGNWGNSDDTIHLEASGAYDNQPYENRESYREVWVGYFKENPAEVMDALGSVSDQLIGIKSHDWSIMRSSRRVPWVMPPNPCYFEYGQCYVLQFAGTTSVDFTWQTSDPITPTSMQRASYFTYSEDPDYVPVYAYLQGVNVDPEAGAELGIFVNDQCVGAEVVVSDSVQVNAYILSNPDITIDDLEFRYWDGSKRDSGQKITNYRVFDEGSSSFIPKKQVQAESRGFYQVQLDFKNPEAGSTPSWTCLYGNYPNPFNPETTIKFDIAQPGKVALDIYNIKGQKVRTLVNDTREPGTHTAVWNGRDDSGKSVASGVFFYRLTVNGETMTRKMLLMK